MPPGHAGWLRLREETATLVPQPKTPASGNVWIASTIVLAYQARLDRKNSLSVAEGISRLELVKVPLVTGIHTALGPRLVDRSTTQSATESGQDIDTPLTDLARVRLMGFPIAISPLAVATEPDRFAVTIQLYDPSAAYVWTGN